MSRNRLDQPPWRTPGPDLAAGLSWVAGQALPKSLFANQSEATKTPVTGHSGKTGCRALPATMLTHVGAAVRSCADVRGYAPSGRAGYDVSAETVHHSGENPPCSK
ncbi:MAG: hypothetical protein V6Z89_15270 [Desulfobacter sp.]